MPEIGPPSRREFVATTGAAAVASLAGAVARAGTAPARARYAMVGTGHRGTGMWGAEVLARHPDAVEFVGLCDSNPLRLEAGRKLIGVTCPTFTDFDQMLATTKPDTLAVTTTDSEHHKFIIKGLERGIRVITEKPMITDEVQCQAVLDTEKRTGNMVTVAFNYRYSPKHRRIKELLMEGAIGKVTSVDFSWYLDTSHGADYFRRWHRLVEKGGSLFVHKATHHFDLVNWWLDADPLTAYASGDLKKYGTRGPFRHTHCRPCPHKAECKFHLDITKNARLTKLYSECESADGYHRDGCVFREDVNIYDTMSALVRYSTDVTMAYSVNAFMPFEGHRVAINGESGRIEMRDYERQPWEVAEETELHLTRSFGKRETIHVPREPGGHAGGDPALHKVIFGGGEVPAHMRVPSARAGALSCLTGIAARKSVALKRPVNIAELIRF
jgi:predicted dehydrogenase